MAYLRYDGKEQKWVCDYCGGKFTREELEQRGAETKQDDYEVKPRAEAAENTAEISYHYEENITETDEDLSHLRAYHCPSCGGEIVTDDVTAAPSAEDFQGSEPYRRDQGNLRAVLAL